MVLLYYIIYLLCIPKLSYNNSMCNKGAYTKKKQMKHRPHKENKGGNTRKKW